MGKSGFVISESLIPGYIGSVGSVPGGIAPFGSLSPSVIIIVVAGYIMYGRSSTYVAHSFSPSALYVYDTLFPLSSSIFAGLFVTLYDMAVMPLFRSMTMFPLASYPYSVSSSARSRNRMSPFLYAPFTWFVAFTGLFPSYTTDILSVYLAPMFDTTPLRFMTVMFPFPSYEYSVSYLPV